MINPNSIQTVKKSAAIMLPPKCMSTPSMVRHFDILNQNIKIEKYFAVDMFSYVTVTQHIQRTQECDMTLRRMRCIVSLITNTKVIIRNISQVAGL